MGTKIVFAMGSLPYGEEVVEKRHMTIKTTDGKTLIVPTIYEESNNLYELESVIISAIQSFFKQVRSEVPV